MKEYTKKTDLTFETQALSDPERTLFFDIETTGLARERDRIYLIGCGYLEDGRLTVRQFFAEQPEEERAVLSAFRLFAGSFTTLVHFNGDRFDLPFLQARLHRYGMSDITEGMESLDLYRVVRPVKGLLQLPDGKQKTLERFLGLERTDRFSGGELIDVYHAYTKAPTDDALTDLLTHNREDIEGLMTCLQVLSYRAFTEHLSEIRAVRASAGTYEDLQGARKRELFLELKLPAPLPADVTTHADGCHLRTKGDSATLRLPIIDDELKYFYANYKDYYYLPAEDTAIHKSVAQFVERGHREQAKAATCYTRKRGAYLPQWEALFSPVFRSSYEDKRLYFELTDELKKSREDLSRYAAHVIARLIG